MACTCLVQFTSRVLSHQLFQAAPVSPRHLLGDAAAPLQVQLIHLLAYVVSQHWALPSDLLLERRQRRPYKVNFDPDSVPTQSPHQLPVNTIHTSTFTGASVMGRSLPILTLHFGQLWTYAACNTPQTHCTGLQNRRS